MSSGEILYDEQNIEKKFKVVFVLGPPGSGKGTICQIISPRYSFVHLSAGDLLRKEMNQSNSCLALQIKKHMQEGSIVPVEITCRLISNAMEKTKGFTGNNCFIVDGFPRNENNRIGWELHMKHTDLCAVVAVDCSDEECIKRCVGRECGRVDDKEEILKNRLAQHRTQCLPIIEYYEKQGLVVHINGDQSKEDVCDEVIRKLDPIMYKCLLGEAPEDVPLLGDAKGEEQMSEDQKGNEYSEQPSQPEVQERISCSQPSHDEDQGLSCPNQEPEEQSLSCQAELQESQSDAQQERRSSSQQHQEVEQRRSSSQDQKLEEPTPLCSPSEQQPQENQQA